MDGMSFFYGFCTALIAVMVIFIALAFAVRKDRSKPKPVDQPAAIVAAIVKENMAAGYYDAEIARAIQRNLNRQRKQP